MANPHREAERPIIHADAIALFSIGLQITYLFGVFTYSLHERGWPGWVRAWIPDWLSAVDVLFSLPYVTAALEKHSRPDDSSGFPQLCWWSFIGLIMILMLHAAIRLRFVGWWLFPSIIGVVLIPQFYLRRHLRRRRDREESGERSKERKKAT